LRQVQSPRTEKTPTQTTAPSSTLRHVTGQRWRAPHRLSRAAQATRARARRQPSRRDTGRGAATARAPRRTWGAEGGSCLTERVRRTPRRVNGSGEADFWRLEPEVLCHCRCSLLVRECVSGHLAPLPTEACLPVPWSSVPTGKSTRVLGRVRSVCAVVFELPTPHRDGVTVRVGGGTAFRRAAAGMEQASRKTVGLRTQGA
jgi:hypothetical protein